MGQIWCTTCGEFWKPSDGVSPFVSQQIVDVLDFGGIVGKDVGTGRRYGVVVPMVLGERHTDHCAYGVLAERVEIVGKVFPLVVEAVFACRFDGVFVAVGH